MKKSAFVTALSIGVLSINMAFATPQQAVSQVKGNATQVLQILKQANGKNDDAIRRQAENYAAPYFDFELMTRLSVGAPWNKATAAQKQTLVEEYRKMLIRTYAGQMLRYKNAQVTVSDKATTKNGGAMFGNRQVVDVNATITVPGQQPIKAVFSTYQSGGKYKVFNVSFEGAFKLVQMKQQEFKPILDSKGIEGLIASLKAKNGSK
ncbi:MlaC/ttg2D family ABC transporter substrate-binding protein [Wielerella bovis]|uniref:MlaC/ttg2D family ABC transporter substrate-binding protein n=1 Tax=Wielerella bovis TaxID=2917790 RepID=UPI0020189168|nr:ABC transporter substrate-binding protein [Wielerella bovis]ULJ60744.1 ABC transporter substrate-binding protein [Wielerella bovis]ULJ62933.1 ABC transporter substrate-binding protein [Wielerella bovis]ULJ65165.1 ABC transporter substrate-binding protein [Wielerella bovis]ULJ67439.1 ABC transporter substrate-binding protein [Wielerella bovis]ULJ69742.1 ABC transporter substrate-binding protein [Wielerella bovis]